MAVIESLTVNEFVTPDGVAHPFPVGVNGAYPKTTPSGVVTLVPAVHYARVVNIDVNITTTFAAGDGTAPTFAFGYTGSPTAYSAAINSGSAGAWLGFAGALPIDKALIMTVVTGTGTTEAGAINVTSLVL